MTKKTETLPATYDVELPMYDTASGAITPLLNAAMADGATGRPHETDALKIVVTITDKALADDFQTNVARAIGTVE